MLVSAICNLVGGNRRGSILIVYISPNGISFRKHWFVRCFVRRQAHFFPAFILHDINNGRTGLSALRKGYGCRLPHDILPRSYFAWGSFHLVGYKCNITRFKHGSLVQETIRFCLTIYEYFPDQLFWMRSWTGLMIVNRCEDPYLTSSR